MILFFLYLCLHKKERQDKQLSCLYLAIVLQVLYTYFRGLLGAIKSIDFSNSSKVIWWYWQNLITGNGLFGGILYSNLSSSKYFLAVRGETLWNTSKCFGLMKRIFFFIIWFFNFTEYLLWVWKMFNSVYIDFNI